MNLELASVPLAFVAGILGILSPCVWPLVPVLMSSAASSGRSGPVFLALGLSAAFAVSGTFFTLLLLNLGLNPDGFRYVAAGLLVLVWLPCVGPTLGAALVSGQLVARLRPGMIEGAARGRQAGPRGPTCRPGVAALTLTV